MMVACLAIASLLVLWRLDQLGHPDDVRTGEH